MNTKWDRIQDALGAAIRGDEVRPVVSQRTLFGIPSSVEVQMSRFAAELAQEQAGECKGAHGSVEKDFSSGQNSAYERELRNLVMNAAVALGEAALIGRAWRYFIYDGRSNGFDIPAYPFDPKGELKSFLRSRGACNLPEYYATLGVSRDLFDKVQTHALLVLKRAEGDQQAILLKGAEYCDASKFCPLFKSEILHLCSLECLVVIAQALGIETELVSAAQSEREIEEL